MDYSIQTDLDPDDYQNLLFILSLTSETFDDWWESIDEDDRTYAMALLELTKLNILDAKQAYTGELAESKVELEKIMNKD
jgi:hypothetical protein